MSVESIQEDVTNDANNISTTNNSNTEANISTDMTNSFIGHTDETNDNHFGLEQQPSLVPPFVNVEDSPVATCDSLRRISSVPTSDSFHDSLEQLSLDNTPSLAKTSPSLPRTDTMLMRQQQDQQMATLLSSVSAVLRVLKNSSEISELMTAAQSLSLLCGRGIYRSHANKMIVAMLPH